MAAASVCSRDIPYIQYGVQVTGTDADTVDLTFIDNQGNVVDKLVDQPLTGLVIYPGASEDPPDWPGWKLNDDGFWVTDDSDANLRDGLKVLFEVNPEATATVSYPPESSACASPQNPPTTTPTGSVPPSTTPPALPKTGETTSMTLLALAFLGMGGALVFLARREA